MSRIRVLPLLIVTTWTASAGTQSLAPQRADVTPVTVVSMSERLWTSSVGLKIIVRDVDQPDLSISEARAIVEHMNARSAVPLSATSDSVGIAGIVATDSGEYRVRILRVGYDRLEFRVRLEAECHQVLETYLSRAVKPFDHTIYTVGKNPRRTPTPARTQGRAVLTTCPPA